MRKMKFRVMEILEDGTLKPFNIKDTTFDNPREAEALAYELSTACKANFTVQQIWM